MPVQKKKNLFLSQILLVTPDLDRKDKTETINVSVLMEAVKTRSSRKKKKKK